MQLAYQRTQAVQNSPKKTVGLTTGHALTVSSMSEMTPMPCGRTKAATSEFSAEQPGLPGYHTAALWLHRLPYLVISAKGYHRLQIDRVRMPMQSFIESSNCKCWSNDLFQHVLRALTIPTGARFLSNNFQHYC